MIFEIWLKCAASKRGGHYWRPGTVTASKSKPSTNENEIAVRLKLEIPSEVFEEPVFEATMKLPDVTRKLPETIEIAREVSSVLKERLGFKINLTMTGPDDETKTEVPR